MSKKDAKIFFNRNKLIFKKYKPIKLLGSGTFSSVYQAINLQTKTSYAIKVEKRTNLGFELLEREAYILYNLQCFGIPKFITYGKTQFYNFLVQELLGQSILKLFLSKNKKMQLNDVLKYPYRL